MSLSKNTNPLFADTAFLNRIDSKEYDLEAQILRGTMSFSKEKLRDLDPSYTGYSHLFVLRMPPFMTQVAGGGVVAGYSTTAVPDAQRHCKNLKLMLEMACTSFSGTPDLQLNTTEVNTGFPDRSYSAPTFATYEGKSLTVRCLETRGEPLRRACEYYISGISDPNVKATMLNGAGTGSGKTGSSFIPMEPTLSNYTLVIMTVQTDQTMRNIQDIGIWNNCLLTQFPRNQLDWSNGEIDIVQPIDLQFNAIYMPDARNAIIDKLAKTLLAERLQYYKRFSDMDSTDLGAGNWPHVAYNQAT